MNRNIEQVHAELIAAKDRYNEAREQTRQARKKETEAKIIMQKWQADHVMLMFEEKPLCERLTRLTNGRPAKGDEARRQAEHEQHVLAIFQEAQSLSRETGLPMFSNYKPCVADILAEVLHYSKTKIRNCIAEGRKLTV